MASDADFLAPIAEQIWDLKYRSRDPDGVPVEANVDATFMRVARAAAGVERGGKRRRADWTETFHGAMADFGFLPAGRILAGAGTGRAVTLFNCFVMDRIEDDLSAIFDGVRQAALTMQQGGGVGMDFSTLRPKGALVRSIGADASGPVSFMDVWDAMCRTIMSAGARRGAMMACLRCDHPDIEAFIDAKADPGRLRNFNLSVLVTDAFMEAQRADRPWPLVFGGKVWRTVAARDLWERIMRATYDYAEPGVIFIDRVNQQNNLGYCEAISATNPCVTGETWAQTSKGPRLVRDLVGRAIDVRVDGRDHASDARGFFVTGRKRVVRLETEEGYRLRLTADHRLRAVTHLTRWVRETEWRAAGDLRAGDVIVLNDHRSAPNWGGKLSEGEGYLLGLLVGDGTLKSDKAVISVWWPSIAVNGEGEGIGRGVSAIMDAALRAAMSLPHRADFTGWIEVRGRNEYRLTLGALNALAETLGMRPGAKQITPPMECASSAFYRGFLRGFFDADGSVQGTQAKGVSVRLAQSDLERLEAVQRMLLRLGIVSRIYTDRRPAGESRLPDGRGGMASYPTKASHELVISGDNLVQFRDCVGFADVEKSERLAHLLVSYRRSVNRERFTARVRAIVDDGEDEVYDVSVPGINAFDANGIYAHNCGEQPLPAYGACLLGSINLARLVAQPFTAAAAIALGALEQRARVAVRMLDNIIDVSNYPLAAQKAEAKSKRRIGLGVTGLADALIMCGARYGSPRALELAEGWMAAIQRAAYLASTELASEKGVFPLFDAAALLARPNITALDKDVRAAISQHGMRNGCLTSIAPTGTISLFAGNVSSGIEPVFDHVYQRRLLSASGDAHETTIEDYAHACYRRQFGDAAPLNSAFVTAGELAPQAHLQMQAAMQRHVDSSISKTINCPVDIAFDDFKSVYSDAYAMGLKGCTTYRPNAVTGAVLSPAAAVAALPPGPPVGVTPTSVASGASALPQLLPPAARPDGDLAATGRSGVVYMSRPLERDAALAGFTTKLKWPGSDHALYITINDIVRDGRRRPFEIFINTKNLEHAAWTVALTRMISAVFRRGGDVSFVAEELKAVFDPQGGTWMDGRYVPSLLAAIGEVIEAHMIRIGFLAGPDTVARADPARLAANIDAMSPQPQSGEAAALDRPAPARGSARGATADSLPMRFCPRCSSPEYVREEGCWVCRACGFSRCG